MSFKKYVFWLCFTMASATTLSAQKYVVQVGAFLERVNIKDYYGGMNGVYESKDHNDIYRYYMSFSSEAEANAAAERARAAHYKAVVIDMQALEEQCRSCGASPSKVRSIFFDFDKADLRPKSKADLLKLKKILVENPTYNVELSAHTDAKGDNEYNNNLSDRRATAAKDFLVANGIQNSRIKTTIHGEEDPIAKNELVGGRDTEQGRQLNRRVEIILLDANGKHLDSIVEQIFVPDILKH